MIWIALSFLFFTVMVAVISAWKTRDDKLDTAEGYFLAGRGLPGIVIRIQRRVMPRLAFKAAQVVRHHHHLIRKRVHPCRVNRLQ